MNRRDFLKMAGLGAAGWVLTGCGIQSRREAFEEKKVGGKADGGEVTYRVLPHTQTKISTIGIGSSAIHESSGDEIQRIFDYAADRGINLVDTVMSDFSAAALMGKAMEGKRDKFVTQMHIGVTYPGDTYTRTRNAAQVKEGFEK